MYKIFKSIIYVLSIIIIIFGLWILTRPCSLYPFQSHDCYDCGFKKATGRYPTAEEKVEIENNYNNK